MICWKQRGGWPVQKGPGAIIFHKDNVVRNSKTGDRILWEGSIFQNQLWRAGANMRVGKKRESNRKMRTEEDD